MNRSAAIPNFSHINATPIVAGTKVTNSPNYLKRKYACCCKGGITADQVMMVLVVLTIIATIVAIIFAIIFASNQDSLQRFCVTATPDNVAGGAGEAGGLAVGFFSMYSVQREIGYEFQFENISTITAIHVRGPIQPGSGQIGAFKFSLCGSPSTVVCDVTTTPGLVNGWLDQLSPSNTGLRAEITAIRKEPIRYYLEFLTNDNPITPGALRAPLDSICGTP